MDFSKEYYTKFNPATYIYGYFNIGTKKIHFDFSKEFAYLGFKNGEWSLKETYKLVADSDKSIFLEFAYKNRNKKAYNLHFK